MQRSTRKSRKDWQKKKEKKKGNKIARKKEIHSYCIEQITGTKFIYSLGVQNAVGLPRRTLQISVIKYNCSDGTLFCRWKELLSNTKQGWKDL
jgi:hypothetical protein